VHALRDDVEFGSTNAVIGPSGCGKSTLYILDLLDEADSGFVSIASEHVSDLPEEEWAHRRNELIAFIFQFHFLIGDFSAHENVMIPMCRLGRLSEPEMRERAGKQQRVAIARALAKRSAGEPGRRTDGNLDTRNSQRRLRIAGKSCSWTPKSFTPRHSQSLRRRRVRLCP
jgi:lipoprotein-releasing system ATP-binding protein